MIIFTSLKRVIKTGYLDFYRNIGLSAATVLIMVMVIFLVTLLSFLSPISKSIIFSVQERVDISVYFKEDALPEDIFEVKTQLVKISEVKEVEYVSKEDALANFTEAHKDDQTIMNSLTELGSNPFLPSLNIRAYQASQYESVAKFLENSSSKDLFDKVDYHQRKPIIEKVAAIVGVLNRIVILLSVVLGAIAFVVAFNAIKIAIYSTSEEISVMRLVGASNWFVRGPFIVQGVIVGALAAVIALLITSAISYGLDSKIKFFAPEISVFSLFLANFWKLFLLQLATGIGLGVISSFFAIRKYLKI